MLLNIAHSCRVTLGHSRILQVGLSTRPRVDIGCSCSWTQKFHEASRALTLPALDLDIGLDLDSKSPLNVKTISSHTLRIALGVIKCSKCDLNHDAVTESHHPLLFPCRSRQVPSVQHVPDLPQEHLQRDRDGSGAGEEAELLLGRQERARAAAMGYEDPTCENPEATTNSYHKCLTEILSRVKSQSEKHTSNSTRTRPARTLKPPPTPTTSVSQRSSAESSQYEKYSKSTKIRPAITLKPPPTPTTSVSQRSSAESSQYEKYSKSTKIRPAITLRPPPTPTTSVSQRSSAESRVKVRNNLQTVGSQRETNFNLYEDTTYIHHQLLPQVSHRDPQQSQGNAKLYLGINGMADVKNVKLCCSSVSRMAKYSIHFSIRIPLFSSNRKGEMRGRVGIMVASHNEDTVRYAIQLMKKYDIKPEDRVVCFGQLLGMCDHVTFPLDFKKKGATGVALISNPIDLCHQLTAGQKYGSDLVTLRQIHISALLLDDDCPGANIHMYWSSGLLRVQVRPLRPSPRGAPIPLPACQRKPRFPCQDQEGKEPTPEGDRPSHRHRPGLLQTRRELHSGLSSYCSFSRICLRVVGCQDQEHERPLTRLFWSVYLAWQPNT
ncbi:proline dehydrogenase domain-containing protein [Phthorimaea operculella]|nr:proline dehydrogenase domain-containing protein [Phthorimaea operculella]